MNYLKDILGDYYRTDEYIKERKKELLYVLEEKMEDCFEEESKTQERMTITTDRRLWNLEKNKRAVERCLNRSDETTQKIIKEIYLNKKTNLTLLGMSQKLFISKTQAYNLRNLFFEQLADELGI